MLLIVPTCSSFEEEVYLRYKVEGTERAVLLLDRESTVVKHATLTEALNGS